MDGESPTVISDTEPSTLALQVEEAPITEPELNFYECERVIADIPQVRRRWAREDARNWEGLLQQGHSLDEVTLAIEHFSGVGWARSFRLQQLRAHTELNQQLVAHYEQFAREYPELVELGFRFMPRLPSATLTGFADMSESEQKAALSEHRVLVDELSYFIRQEDVSDDDILLMMSYAEDIFEMLSLDSHYSALSLLDSAVKASRVAVVEALLEAGLRPTEDAYLGSTMEWALHLLSRFGGDEDKEQNAARIVSMLQPFNARARFERKSSREVKGGFVTRNYQFDRDDIIRIRDTYGLDLTQIESREPIAVDPEHALIQLLEAEREQYLRDEAQTSSAELKTCEALVMATYQQWQPRSESALLQEVMARYPDSPDRVMFKLSQIDPKLVDRYREEHQRRSRIGEFLDSSDALVEQLRQGDIDSVIAYYQDKAPALSDLSVNLLMWQIIDWDLNYYERLRQSGILREPFQYYDLPIHRSYWRYADIEQLEAIGVNMRGEDSRAKSLVYYAVRGSKVDELEALEANGYPFSYDQFGQDPLHLALSWGMGSPPIDKVEQMLPILMRFSPQIDEHHESRMALLRLKYPHHYERLTADYPELAVSPDTKLPLMD